jgi:hypothetical protein
MAVIPHAIPIRFRCVSNRRFRWKRPSTLRKAASKGEEKVAKFRTIKLYWERGQLCANLRQSFDFLEKTIDSHEVVSRQKSKNAAK